MIMGLKDPYHRLLHHSHNKESRELKIYIKGGGYYITNIKRNFLPDGRGLVLEMQ